mgnify:CR=1 FL=1
MKYRTQHPAMTSMGVIVAIEEKYRPTPDLRRPCVEKDVVKYNIHWLDGTCQFVYNLRWLSENNLEKIK